MKALLGLRLVTVRDRQPSLGGLRRLHRVLQSFRFSDQNGRSGFMKVRMATAEDRVPTLSRVSVTLLAL